MGGVGDVTFKIEAFGRQLRGDTRFFVTTAKDALVRSKALRELCTPDGAVTVYDNGAVVSVNELERLAKRE